MNVLIVDDERGIRATLKAFIRLPGHSVQSVENAREALQLLKDGAFDVIVSDILLPGLSGMELLRIAREASPSCQVILMTGAPTIETMSEALRAGASDYLVKPVTKADILGVMERAARVKNLNDERLLLKKENLAYQQDLEQLVAKRTSQLEEANRQLRQALNEVKETQRQMIHNERMSALGQMASGIAHDFNNALVPIVGLSDMLKTDGSSVDPATLKEMIQEIHSAADDARRIVMRLKEFYRPSQAGDFEPVAINDIIEKAVSLTRPKWKQEAEAKGKRIKIATQLGEVPLVSGIPSELREVFINLILNAIAAMPEGGTISLRTLADREFVRVAVSDNGTGMPEAVRRRCFEPFFSTKGEHGTGLGLAMVHGTMQRHSGQIEVDSEPGKGTTFYLRLPAITRASERKRVIDEPPMPVAVPALSILVVDDEASSRRLVSRVLTRCRQKFQTASSGQEGLSKLRDGQFDVLITDLAMPEMSGADVAREAKKIKPDLRIILLTGFGDMMIDRKEKPDGVDLVVSKPVTEKELCRALLDTTGDRP